MTAFEPVPEYDCSCFFSSHIYIKELSRNSSKSIDRHFEYTGKDAFFERESQFLATLTARETEELISLITAEIARRKGLVAASKVRRDQIKVCYEPIDRGFWDCNLLKQEEESIFRSEFLELVALARTKLQKMDWEATWTQLKDELGIHKQSIWEHQGIFSFPVFTKEFCERLVMEVDNFQISDCPKGRPNSMNNYGTLFNEMGLDSSFITPFRQEYVQPIAAFFYGGQYAKLTHHRTFTVVYSKQEDTALSTHFDNSEVTINVNLGTDFDGGDLVCYPEDDRGNQVWISHKLGYGVLHLGKILHRAAPTTRGRRVNFVHWARSEEFRMVNGCPMCGKTDRLCFKRKQFL